MTMAALLHRDADGDALVTALIKASPVDAATWVRSYLRAYLRPLVHCLYAYDLAFMPHGENLVLVLRDHVPVRALMKDIGEEVAVMGPHPLPPEVERIRGSFPDDVKALAIHTDVFDGVLRFVAAILAEDGVLDADEFWGLVRETIEEHAADHPELAAAADALRPAATDVPAQLPQPAPAPQHAADGGSDRPGRVADVRRHAGQPGGRVR